MIRSPLEARCQLACDARARTGRRKSLLQPQKATSVCHFPPCTRLARSAQPQGRCNSAAWTGRAEGCQARRSAMLAVLNYLQLSVLRQQSPVDLPVLKNNARHLTSYLCRSGSTRPALREPVTVSSSLYLRPRTTCHSRPEDPPARNLLPNQRQYKHRRATNDIRPTKQLTGPLGSFCPAPTCCQAKASF